MTYDIKNLNVASLDFDDIVTSLSTFLNEQPDLADIDFRSPGSAANMLINILATATAYNGVYSQFSYINSWPSSANMIEGVLSSAALASIVIPYSKSASVTATVNVGATAGMAAYTPFTGVGLDGSEFFFYTIDDLPYGYSTANLYAGTSYVTYTNYDYTSQSIEVPREIDPDTISFYTSPVSGSTAVTKWTRVDKANQTATDNQNIFTVINSAGGYLITNAFPNAENITTANKAYVIGVTTNGNAGNNASIQNTNSLATLTYYTPPSSGYDTLTIEQAKAKFNFNSNGQQRCVTINDFKNAIVNSGIPGTEIPSNVTVVNAATPATVKIYVNGLSSNNQLVLLNYISSRTIAGISVIYSQ